MNQPLYKILWIDDEHEALTGFIGRAKRNRIKLIPFKSLNSGVNELEMNYPQYDGVLLDAKFFENENDQPGTEDTSASFRAKERILQLPKKFEIFVLSGQAEAYENNTYKMAFANVYEKGKDIDIERLFTNIKEAAQQQIDTQIRFTYQRAFSVCTEKYLGKNTERTLLHLLKVQETTNSEDYFNSIRKVVEDLFRAFNKFDLIPSKFVSSQVSLGPSCKFLVGEDIINNKKLEKFKHGKDTCLPKQIAASLKNILSVTQPGSHRSYIDQHVRAVSYTHLTLPTICSV